MKKKNKIDDFLDFYKRVSDDKIEYTRIYERPSKVKCLLYFIFTLLLLLIAIRYLLGAPIVFIIFVIIDLLVCLYYGYNLFSKKGFIMGRTIKVKKEEDKDEEA